MSRQCCRGPQGGARRARGAREAGSRNHWVGEGCPQVGAKRAQGRRRAAARLWEGPPALQTPARRPRALRPPSPPTSQLPRHRGPPGFAALSLQPSGPVAHPALRHCPRVPPAPQPCDPRSPRPHGPAPPHSFSRKAQREFFCKLHAPRTQGWEVPHEVGASVRMPVCPGQAVLAYPMRT